MKRHFTLIIPMLLLLMGTTAARAQFTPAPVEGDRFTFITKKALGEKVILVVEARKNNIWIDLNGDGVYQEGEQMDRTEEKSYTIQSQKLTIYGALSYLGTKANQITEFDLSKMPNLEAFYCGLNPLKTLTIADMPNLTKLGCYSNQLTSLTLRNLPKLSRLYCYDNKLESLDFSGLSNLNLLACYDNSLKSLDLSVVPTVVGLYCSGNQLLSLDITPLSNLGQLTCYGNQIKEAEMQKIVEALPTPTFTGRFIPYNPKGDDKNECTSSQVALAKSKNWKVITPQGKDFPGTGDSPPFTPAPTNGARIAFTTTKAKGDKIKLKLQAVPANAWIDLDGDGKYREEELLLLGAEKEYVLQTQNPIIYGDVHSITCADNMLTVIDLVNTPNLTVLQCWDNQLTALKLASAPKLTELLCYRNQIESLDLPAVPQMRRLNCAVNKLTSLDLSKSANLEQLHIDFNQIESLNLSNVPKLKWLYCSVNKFTSLDLSKTSNLEHLYCSENQFAALDISATTKLSMLACYDNQIKEAEMQKIVDVLPLKGGVFVPYDPSLKGEKKDKNICTKAQVLIAKKRNWAVTDPEGKPFAGLDGLQTISDARLPITLISKEGVLSIAGIEEGMLIEVYTLDGLRLHRSVAEGAEANIALPAASYLLRIGNYSAKAIVL